MVDFEEAFNLVMPFLPSCPEPIAIDGLRNATIELCERTRIWKSEDRFTLSSGINDVCVPNGSTLIKVEGARLNGKTLEPISTQALNSKYQSYDWRQLEGEPEFITQTEHDTLTIVPKGEGTIELATVLAPSFDAERIPRFIMSRYKQTLAQGAIAYAMMLPSERYYNPDLAMTFRARFERDLDRLSTKGHTGQQGAPIRSKPSYF